MTIEITNLKPRHEEKAIEAMLMIERLLLLRQFRARNNARLIGLSDPQPASGPSVAGGTMAGGSPPPPPRPSKL